jgi:hypothetical protein
VYLSDSALFLLAALKWLINPGSNPYPVYSHIKVSSDDITNRILRIMFEQQKREDAYTDEIS